jgi:hypothetical protein
MKSEVFIQQDPDDEDTVSILLDVKFESKTNQLSMTVYRETVSSDKEFLDEIDKTYKYMKKIERVIYETTKRQI